MEITTVEQNIIQVGHAKEVNTEKFWYWTHLPSTIPNNGHGQIAIRGIYQIYERNSAIHRVCKMI